MRVHLLLATLLLRSASSVSLLRQRTSGRASSSISSNDLDPQQLDEGGPVGGGAGWGGYSTADQRPAPPRPAPPRARAYVSPAFSSPASRAAASTSSAVSENQASPPEEWIEADVGHFSTSADPDDADGETTTGDDPSAANDPDADPSADAAAPDERAGPRVLYVSGRVGDGDGKSFGRELAGLPPVATQAVVPLVVDSKGGLVDEGKAIGKLIKGAGRPFIVVNTGRVASIAVLVFAAAPNAQRVALKGSSFGFHEPTSRLTATKKERIEHLQARIDALKRDMDNIFGELSKAMGKDAKFVHGLVASLKGGTYNMTACEALKSGLVSQVWAREPERDELELLAKGKPVPDLAYTCPKTKKKASASASASISKAASGSGGGGIVEAAGAAGAAAKR